jgi:hypothetical protein
MYERLSDMDDEFDGTGMLNWLLGPDVDDLPENCGLCRESLDGEDCAEVVMTENDVHVVCHAQCAVWAVEAGTAVMA